MTAEPRTRMRRAVHAVAVGVCIVAGMVRPAEAAEDAAKRDAEILRCRRQVASKPAMGVFRARLAFLLYLKFQDEDDRSALDEAVKHAARAVKLSPNVEDVRRIAARCFLSTDTAPGRTTAREHAEAALRLDPNDPLTIALLGRIAIHEGDYDQARKHYQKRQEIADDLYAHWKWAYLYQEMGQGAKALQEVEKALARDEELTSHRADLTTLKAWLLFELGRPEEAGEAVERALALEKDNLSAIRARAYMAKNLGRFEEAVAWYLKIPAARRHAIDAENIADAYQAMEKADQAKQFYAHAVQLYEQQVAREEMGGYNNLAYFLASRGRDPDRALRLAQKAVQVSPRYHVFDTLAWAYYRKGKYAEALKWQQKASVQPCDQAIWHFHLGMIQWKLGHRAEARRSLRKTLDLNPHFHYLHAREARHVLARRLAP